MTDDYERGGGGLRERGGGAWNEEGLRGSKPNQSISSSSQTSSKKELHDHYYCNIME